LGAHASRRDGHIPTRAGIAVVLEELARHRDLDAIPFWIGQAIMPKSISDMMPSPNSFSISTFQAGPMTITSS
jgi:hypothetical protein